MVYISIPTIECQQNKQSFGLAQRPSVLNWKPAHCSLPVGSEMIQPVPVVCDLDVLLDASLSTVECINKVVLACYYQLWRLLQISCCLGPEVTTQLVLAISVRLLQFSFSFCPTVYRWTNSACPECHHNGDFSPLVDRNMWCLVLIQLHWLPVCFRITHKFCIPMYNIWAGKSAHYLSNIMELLTTKVTCSSLLSVSEMASYTQVQRAHVLM